MTWENRLCSWQNPKSTRYRPDFHKIRQLGAIHRLSGKRDYSLHCQVANDRDVQNLTNLS